jgi:predicted DNA-binding transcriptional regulator YafY
MEPDEKLVLTMKEMQRIEILRRLETRRLTVEAGATALGRSVRTVFRMLGKLRSKGIKGLRHGNKGRPSGLEDKRGQPSWRTTLMPRGHAISSRLTTFSSVKCMRGDNRAETR